MSDYKDDPTPYISYHQLSTYRRCPKIIDYWHSIPDDKKIEDGRNAFVGTCVHTVAEMYLNAQITLKECISASVDVAKKLQDETVIKWRGDKDRNTLISSIPRHIAQLTYHFKANDIRPDNSETEKTVKVKLKSLILAGRIDVVKHDEDGDHLFDFKATDRPKGTDLDQMLFYFILSTAAGYSIKTGTFLFTKDGTQQRMNRNSASERKLLEECVIVAARIKEGMLSMTPGYACSFCEFREVCPGAKMAARAKEDVEYKEPGWQEWT